jgi:hypothetical protein
MFLVEIDILQGNKIDIARRNKTYFSEIKYGAE